MNNKKIVAFIIMIFSVLYTGLFIYYIKDNEEKPNLNIKKNIVDNTMTVDKVLNFIKNNKIDYLDNINKSFTSEDITNQNKLRYVYYSLRDEVDFNSGVSYTKFEAYIKNVFGSTTIIKTENIINNEKKVLLQYDETNEVYKYTNEMNEYDLMYSYYNYVIDFKTENEKYILSVNKFFVIDNEVYASIDDAKTRKNMLFIVDINNINDNIKKYVTINYEKVKHQIHEYKYTFEKEKGNLILKKYEKIQKDDKNM